ncbi:MAG: response regulator [Pirellulaceae bacterium]|jgi:two-component system response regulator RegA|nr:response regulator [Pirellulaceae bacterium]
MSTGHRLLIIEDDEAFASALRRTLSSRSFECAVCHDAGSALRESDLFRPTHILLDMHLAEDSGLHLIKPLRELLPDCRIVLLTGYASIATAVDAISLGANDYISKPADTNTIVKTLSGNPNDVSNADDEVPLTPERLEWEHIQQVLRVNDGNISATARQLGMHRRTLQRKLQKRPSARRQRQ